MSPISRDFPLRIASLAPSVTSILLALGARRRLVAVSKWCKEVADVRGLPEVGDCWALNAQELAKYKPTLVIGSVPFRTETVDKLLHLRAAFLALNPRSLADIDADIRMLGRLVGRNSGAEKLIRAMRRGFQRVERRSRRLKFKPRVYCEAWPNPRISSPPWVAELVEIAGGRAVVPAGQRVSDEEVARASPDLIVLAWTATAKRSKPSSALENPRWQNVPAVRNHRVAVIHDALLNTPGPPLLEGAGHLLRALHPELFSCSGPNRKGKQPRQQG